MALVVLFCHTFSLYSAYLYIMYLFFILNEYMLNSAFMPLFGRVLRTND
jgi:hypothetical protein